MSGEQVKSVIFNKTPDVRIRVIDNSDNKILQTNKKLYPFELHNTICITVVTDKRTFDFTIFNGYTWNGADIPRLFWRVIGSRTDNDFLIASLLHDYLLEFKVYILNDILKNSMSKKEYRRLTSLIFRHVLKEQGTNVIKANIMSWSVQVFQTICCRKAWAYE